MNGNWFVAELVDGTRLRGRTQIEVQKQSGAFPFRIEMHWKKSDKEFDEDMTAKMEEQLMLVMEKNNDAFLTLVSEKKDEYVYTWYARNIETFGRKLNNVLVLFPPLPLEIFSMDDPEWLAYKSASKVVDNFN